MIDRMKKKVGSAAAAAAGCIAFGCALDASAAQILVDFGTNTNLTTTDTVARTWNNVTQLNDVSGSPFTLLTTGNADSGYRLTVGNPPGVTNAVGFNSNNTAGAATPTGTAAARNYPSTATSDSLYGNTSLFGSSTVEAVRLTVSNLNPAETYSFDFFAARISAGGDNRQTEYRVVGGSGFDTSVFLNASENTGNIVGVTGVSPNASNQIVIDIDPGPSNNNASGFFYLNVLEINSVPEPTGIGLLAIAAGAMLARRRRAI